LAGRTILLHAEQGLGDTLQFVRYAPLVKARGGTVVLEVQEPLFSLVATCPGVDRLVALGAPLPPFDTHAPLLSLPGLLATDLASIPVEVPYLAADPALVEHWKAVRSPVRWLKVGIAWQGNPRHVNDRHRSLPLARFEPLARLEGVRLLSLQRGPGSEQLAGAAGWMTADLGDALECFRDTAAAIRNLDLVVTVDSAVAHCAGALAAPVWVLLPYAPDWRWLLGRDDSPWYPTMRLFRQAAPGDWDGVIDRVRVALAELAADRPGG
jgi:hypothetical protein